MSKLLRPGQGRIATQICALSAVAALMSGCSSDSTRFGDAFGNPFATGSTAPKPAKTASASRSMGTGRTPPVSSSALPPRGSVASSSRPAPVSRETTGSIGPIHNAAPTSAAGWRGQGGASVQVGEGDTAAVLAQRYGVPESVLLQTNGLHSAGEIRPGSTIVVPVYNAVATAPGGSRVAQSTPAVRPEPAPHLEPPRAEPRVAAAEPVREALPAVKTVPAHAAKAEVPPARVARAEPPAPSAKAVPAPRPAAAGPPVAKAKVQAIAKAAPVKLVPAKATAAPVKLAATPAPKAPVVKAELPAAKPAPKAQQLVAIEPKKPVDATPTASVPTTPTAPAVVADAGGPEFRWPARGRIIQGFKGGAGGNDGINIAVPEGTQVKAAEGGVVAYAGSELKGYGNLVLIRHPNGYVTAYANNGELDVKRGETVKRGQLIAKSGQSGNVSSPQLHFELRKGSQPVDPTSFLAGL